MPITKPRYDGTDSGPIDLATARQFVKNYQDNEGPGAIRSNYFGRDIIDQILAQPGCTGLRIYNALSDNGETQQVISAVDNKGNDMLPDSGNFTLANHSFPCPPICPDEMSL